MDKVLINNLQVETIIGIFDWEREVKQVVSIDLEMEFDNKKAAKSDDIKDALDYKKVGKRITAFVKKSKYKLVERLAEQIAKLVLKEFPINTFNIITPLFLRFFFYDHSTQPSHLILMTSMLNNSLYRNHLLQYIYL